MGWFEMMRFSAVLCRLVVCTFVLGVVAYELPSTGADEWRQWRGDRRDGVWRETGIIDQFDTESLSPLWRQPVSSGYCGPTVARGKVLVMDRVVKPEQLERIHCFDAASGELLWSQSYQCEYANIGYTAGPRASVTIDGTQAFALGAMGHLSCLDADTGQPIWLANLDARYKISETDRMPYWGIAASPLVYGQNVIVHIGGADGACIVALNRQTGEEAWRALDDRAQYSSPIMIQQGGKDVLLCWTGDSVAGLNPESGEVYWRYDFKPSRMPIGVATPIVQGNRVFLTSFYDGSLMLELSDEPMQAEKVWAARGRNERVTKAIHSIINTPVWIDDHIYGVDSYGEFRCIRAADGERVWSDESLVPKARWGTAHFVQHQDRVWIFTERGELVLAKFTPEKMEVFSRAKILEPTREQLRQRGGVCWAHPAFANKCIFVRNDKEIICYSLAAETPESDK